MMSFVDDVTRPALPALALGYPSLTDDVRETLRAIEWSGKWDGGAGRAYDCCPFCDALRQEGQHMEDCRVMLLLARVEVPR